MSQSASGMCSRTLSKTRVTTQRRHPFMRTRSSAWLRTSANGGRTSANLQSKKWRATSRRWPGWDFVAFQDVQRASEPNGDRSHHLELRRHVVIFVLERPPERRPARMMPPLGGNLPNLRHMTRLRTLGGTEGGSHS